jgi:prophage maintenance system killer protein
VIKELKELKNEIQEIAKNSGVDKVSNSVERNILAIQRKLSNLDQKVKYIRKNMSLIKLKEGVQTIIDDYYNKINTIGKNESEVAEQKLAAAIECCQNLDQLHAFADGNVRTATLVLNKFLIELGEYPCIFDNPNVLDVKSIRELMQYVRKGQEKFKSYKN